HDVRIGSTARLRLPIFLFLLLDLKAVDFSETPELWRRAITGNSAGLGQSPQNLGGGLPPQFENGAVAEDLLSNKYGHGVHFWDLRARKDVQTIDLGVNHQMVLEVRPAHDPIREYGFLGVFADTANLEGSIWTRSRDGGNFHMEKTATIPTELAPWDLKAALAQMRSREQRQVRF
ncbi:MAG: selenium-binding protein SBP56-related protein, partial [Rhodomicrobium sp.]